MKIIIEFVDTMKKNLKNVSETSIHGNIAFNQIVTMDETWVDLYDLETKQQSVK